MTENQDLKVLKEFGANAKWCYVGDAGEWPVYQVDGTWDLFATDPDSDKVSFEVYEENGEFVVC